MALRHQSVLVVLRTVLDEIIGTPKFLSKNTQFLPETLQMKTYFSISTDALIWFAEENNKKLE